MNCFKKCDLSVTEDNRLIIATTNSDTIGILSGENGVNELKDALMKVIEKEIDFDIVAIDSKAEFKKNYPDLSVINMEIETEN